MPRKLKPACPENCHRNLPEAIRLLKLYTDGSCDVFALEETRFTAQRADILRSYCGRDIPFGGCKSAAMLETLAEHARELGAEIDSAGQLAKWCQEYQPPASTPAEPVEEPSAASDAADDRGQEAAESPELPASSGEETMTTATATRPKRKPATKKAAAPKATKATKPAKTPRKAAEKPADPPAKGRSGKQWEGYQGWELIRGLKREGVEIDGVKTILSGVGLNLSPGFLSSVYKRRADAGQVSGKQPTKIAPEHMAELRKKFKEAFAAK